MPAFLIALLAGAGQYLVKLLISGAVGAAVYLISTAAVPAFLQSAGNPFAGLDPSVLYFLNVAHFPFGLSVVGAAYTWRFSFRRAENATKAG